MQNISIDFRRQPRTARAGVVMLVAGAFGAAAVLSWSASLDSETGRIEAQVTEIERLARRVPDRGATYARDARDVPHEVRVANTVMRQLTVPWDRLFSELESRANADVALLSVQPDAERGMVRIDGEARNLQAMLDYSRQLEGTELLDGVVLLGHQVRTQDPQRPVAFAVTAAWRHP